MVARERTGILLLRGTGSESFVGFTGDAMNTSGGSWNLETKTGPWIGMSQYTLQKGFLRT